MTQLKPYNGLLGLDRLPKWAKIAIWLPSFILVEGISLLLVPSLGDSLAFALAINCFVSAGLRLAGIRWRYIFAFWLAIFMLLWATLSIMYVIAAINTIR